MPGPNVKVDSGFGIIWFIGWLFTNPRLLERKPIRSDGTVR